MNDQQGRELAFSARQVVPGQLSYRDLNSSQLSYLRLRRSRRRFVKGISLLVIASLLLVIVLELGIRLNHDSQQPMHTTQAVFSSQDA